MPRAPLTETLAAVFAQRAALGRLPPSCLRGRGNSLPAETSPQPSAGHCTVRLQTAENLEGGDFPTPVYQINLAFVSVCQHDYWQSILYSGSHFRRRADRADMTT